MTQRQEYIIAGQGVPVVLLHSSMASKEQWFKLTQLLRPLYKVISIDLYGYGAASFPAKPDSFSLLDESSRIHDIVVQIIGDTPFHLVGHSYGGATALRLAYNHENQVKSLSCYEPVAFHLLEKDDPVFISIESIVHAVDKALEQNNPVRAARHFVDFWSGAGTYGSLNKIRQAALNKVIGKVALDFQALINDPLELKDYKNLKVPTCLVTGTHSRDVTRKIVHLLKEFLPNTELHEINGAHMAPVAQAETVNIIWETFLRSQETDRTNT